MLPARPSSSRSGPTSSASTSAAIPRPRASVTHHFACTQAGYPGWVWAVTVATRPARSRDGRRDRAAARRGRDHRPAVGALARPDPAGRPVARATCCRPTRTTRGWSRRTSPASGRTTPRSRVVDELGLGRARVLSIGGPRPRRPALVRRRPGTRRPARPVGARPMRRLRLPGAPRRPARPRCSGSAPTSSPTTTAAWWPSNHGCGAHSEAQLRKKQLPPPMPDHVFDTISRDDLEEF